MAARTTGIIHFHTVIRAFKTLPNPFVTLPDLCGCRDTVQPE
jgi:hypothetical protein